MKQTLLLITTLVFIFFPALIGQQQTTDGGYIIGCTTYSYVHGSSKADFLVYKLDASGSKLWRKNFGGDDSEYYSRVIQTSDGGYAVCGQSYGYTHGSGDFLVYKLDASGAKQWRKNYGGSAYEDCLNIVQTTDGGYAMSGFGDSYSSGMMDLLVYKVDAAGTKQWRKNFGGSGYENNGYVIQTSDDGYMLAGRSDTYSNGGADFVLYKLNASGAKLWRKHFGGPYYDTARVVRQTSDGGYILGGYSASYATLPTGGRLAFTPYDYLVYKLDANGAKLWRKHFGGVYNDRLYDLNQTPDGGYILFGESRSYNQIGSDYDFLIYKLSATGAKQWRKNYGGEKGDYGWMASATSDGNYFLFGDTESFVHGPLGPDSDLLVYKVDPSGTKLWRKNYGGVESDYTNPK